MRVKSSSERSNAYGELYRAYYADVAAYADQLATRLANGEFADAGEFNDAVERECDDAFIYTADAYDCIYLSTRSEDARQELINQQVTIDNPMLLSIWAAVTFKLDIREHYAFPDVNNYFDELDVCDGATETDEND